MEERWEGWRWSCWNTISFEFKHWGQEIANFKQRYLKVSHRPMQEDRRDVRDPIMCVTCDAICVRDGLSENRKYFAFFLRLLGAVFWLVLFLSWQLIIQKFILHSGHFFVTLSLRKLNQKENWTKPIFILPTHFFWYPFLAIGGIERALTDCLLGVLYFRPRFPD